MSKRRSRVQIIFDILNAIKRKGGTIKPTHLLYKSNLSHSLTDKGYTYLAEFTQVQKFMESFGLDDI